MTSVEVMQAQTFQCMQLLCICISTYWDISQGGGHHQIRKELSQSSGRTELLTRALVYY